MKWKWGIQEFNQEFEPALQLLYIKFALNLRWIGVFFLTIL